MYLKLPLYGWNQTMNIYSNKRIFVRFCMVVKLCRWTTPGTLFTKANPLNRSSQIVYNRIFNYVFFSYLFALYLMHFSH